MGSLGTSDSATKIVLHRSDETYRKQIDVLSWALCATRLLVALALSIVSAILASARRIPRSLVLP
jgi:hypothetical protein